MIEPDQDSGKSKRQSFLKRSIDEVLLDLSPVEVKAIFASAIPHWVDRTLFQKLIGEDTQMGKSVELMEDFKFARRNSFNNVHYRNDVRKILLDRQRQSALNEYLENNRIAWAYFNEQAVQATALEQPSLEREALYHLLIINEPAGLRLLNEKLEEELYYHQLGSADQFVDQAAQLHEQLSENGKQWLSYFKACLELASLKDDQGESTFHSLNCDSSDKILRALAGWKLGQILVSVQIWSKAIQIYKSSVKALEAAGEIPYLARVMSSLGDAYSDLAERSGGYVLELPEQRGKVRRFLILCQHLPFLVIEWLVRRISFLPSLYFGTNYQDWIIDWLLFVAEGWLVKAERLFASTDKAVELSEARLKLTRLEHQVGHWSRAKGMYSELEKTPIIRGSNYRFAKLRLGQGQANLAEGKLVKAIDQLSEAESTFRIYQDETSSGSAYFLMGKAYAGLSRPAEAAEAFLASAASFEATGDSLALTGAIWSLEQIGRRFPLSQPLKDKIDTLRERIPARHTITRFPERIMRLYRSLALLVALPLAYLLIYQAGSAVAILLSFMEWEFLASTSGIEEPVVQIVTVIGQLALPIMLSFWIYRGIYSLFGLVAVYILGRLLVPIEQEQPMHLTIDRSGVTSYYSPVDIKPLIKHETTSQRSQENAKKISWSEITDVMINNYQAISRPIGLISRTFLRAGSITLVIEGISSGYQAMLGEIQRILTARAEPLNIRVNRFTFLEWKSTLITFALVMAFTKYLIDIGQIEVFGSAGEKTIILPFGTVIEFGFPTLSLVLLAVMLWRLFIYLYEIRKQVGEKYFVIHPGLVLGTAVITTIFSVYHIWYLVFTK